MRGHWIILSVVLLAVTGPVYGQNRQPTSQPEPKRQHLAPLPSRLTPNPPLPGFDAEGSDVKATGLADLVMKKLGGRKAWDKTRYLTWNFFGSRRHIWDKHTGDLRIDATDRESGAAVVILMNVLTNEGRAWREGSEITEQAALRKMLHDGLSWWINDSYWLVMPYKLKDTGVTLKYAGVGSTLEGREADILQLTFSDIGRTPGNKYLVYVVRASTLVEQWDFYRNADDEQPMFQIPWRKWTEYPTEYGPIMLSGNRGERDGRAMELTDIAIFDELPQAVFASPEPVTLPTAPDDAGEAESDG